MQQSTLWFRCACAAAILWFRCASAAANIVIPMCLCSSNIVIPMCFRSSNIVISLCLCSSQYCDSTVLVQQSTDTSQSMQHAFISTQTCATHLLTSFWRLTSYLIGDELDDFGFDSLQPFIHRFIKFAGPDPSPSSWEAVTAASITEKQVREESRLVNPNITRTAYSYTP